MNHLVLLAKSAVESFIKDGKIISSPKDLPEEFPRSEIAELLERKSGTFVTIEKNGQLRGCIGTYLPIRANIAEEIIQNAIAAATEDYRFGPVQEAELPYLSYTVYILSEAKNILKRSERHILSDPELVEAIKKELNPKKYGVIVKTVPITSSGDVVSNRHFVAKTGLLLPDLEGVDTVEKQILIACQKGRIDPLREKIIIYKFTAKKYR